MQERRDKGRKKIEIKAEIVMEDMTCSGTIRNIAEHGMYLETASEGPLNQLTRFTPGKKCEVRFHIQEGENIKLDCRVIWSFKTAPHGMTKKVGLEVVFPPPAYVKFCRTP